MKRRIAVIVLTIAMAIGGLVGTILAAQPSNAGPSYLPRTFVIGPGSQETFFYIYDKSRPPNKLWICGFFPNFTKARFGYYYPDVECFPYGR